MRREVKERYQVTIINKVAALENLQDNWDNNRASDNITEIMNHGLMRNVQNWLMDGSGIS
jgi:CO dehydrogenase/acetyl-CoA synthase gamma subunit (corrinoid Fe-S protein)